MILQEKSKCMKNNINNCIALTALLFLTFNCVGQSKIDTSYFVIENRLKLDNDTYVGMADEFCVYRQFIDSNIFIEKNLFGGDTFQIKQGKWYIKTKKGYSLFFAKEKFAKRGKSKLINSGYTLIPVDHMIFKGEDCYRYKLVPESYKDDPGNNYIIFSNLHGIVSVIYDRLILIRSSTKPSVFIKCT